MPKENPFWNSVRVNGHQKETKNCNGAKKYPKMVMTEPFLWKVYVYLISSTSMQKENSVANSILPDKKSVAQITNLQNRSHNFLMQLPMQLIFDDL